MFQGENKKTSNPYNNNFTSWAHNLLRKRAILTAKQDLLISKQQHREAAKTCSKDGNAMRTTELRHTRKYLSNRNDEQGGMYYHKLILLTVSISEVLGCFSYDASSETQGQIAESKPEKEKKHSRARRAPGDKFLPDRSSKQQG